MSKFPKLSNTQAAILCQIKIQDIQYPLSGYPLPNQRRFLMKKYQSRGGTCKDFQDCFLQF